METSATNVLKIATAIDAHIMTPEQTIARLVHELSLHERESQRLKREIRELQKTMYDRGNK